MKPSPLNLHHLAAYAFAIISILAASGCGGDSGYPSLTNSTNPEVNPPLPFGRHVGTAPYIRHVIVVFQENRTPDNLFQGLPNADIADGGVNSRGEKIPLSPAALSAPYDLDHSHKAFLEMYDEGKMDGADKVRVTCLAKACAPPNPQFVYVPPSEVSPYFDLAEQYTFADRMFQTHQGPSFPAHQFIISGTSAPAPDSDLFAAENPTVGNHPPVNTNFTHSGCAASHLLRVQLIDPTGNESRTQFPCFEHSTLPDLLQDRFISWRYYSIGDNWNVFWNGPAAIHHLRYGPAWSNVVSQKAQVLKDIAAGTLPNVSWVIPDGAYSDHPGNDGLGPSWVAAVVNAIGQSQYWSDTAIFITWDDWGGFYDHVAPPIYNSYEYGFRVPLIVVSPYAKRGYVSHVEHDFGSILRFIEIMFDLPSLGYADSRADDLSDCFDFGQTPALFETIAAPLPAAHFLEDTRPSTPPDDD